jgi:hypothetical protein
MLLLGRRPQQDREALAGFVEGHRRRGVRLTREVAHARFGVDDRLERRVRRDIAYPLAVDPDFAAVAQAGAIFIPCSDHVAPSARDACKT